MEKNELFQESLFSESLPKLTLFPFGSILSCPVPACPCTKSLSSFLVGCPQVLESSLSPFPRLKKLSCLSLSLQERSCSPRIISVSLPGTCCSVSTSLPSVLGAQQSRTQPCRCSVRRGGDTALTAAPGAALGEWPPALQRAGALAPALLPRAPFPSARNAPCASLGAAPRPCPGGSLGPSRGPQALASPSSAQGCGKADKNTEPESALGFQGQSFAYSRALLSESGRDYKITRRNKHEQVLLWQ